MRRPVERLSQRQLVYELRRAIDQDQRSRAIGLVLGHPRGIQSAHVRHNLGARRGARLLAYLDASRSFVRSDGR